MDILLNRINVLFVDPYILGVPSSPHNDVSWSYLDPSYSIWRQLAVTSVFLYVSTLVLYFSCCTVTYWYYFTPRNNNIAMWKYDGEQLFQEVWTSVWSLTIMASMTAPIEVAVVYGYGLVYTDVSTYGWLYLVLSVPLFLVFTDTCIYWIHRILHWPSVYPIHKLHHRYQNTTPWSAFSFHPLDGWAQSVPYHIFVFVFPMHSYLYLALLSIVGLWTMNIHDRFSMKYPGVNGAAHHTIHHTKFLYNYGQYFTFWDQFFNTYLDPYSISPYKDETQYKTKIWGKEGRDWTVQSPNNSNAIKYPADADAAKAATNGSGIAARNGANGQSNGNGSGEH